MVFWLAVIVGGLFAWMAVKIGFYATWIMFFHVLLGVYMAIFVTPVIIVSLPAATMAPYGHALTLLTVAVATMLIGYGTCYACLSGRFVVPFAQVMDKTAAGVLGFLNGFLILSFASFAFAMTPLSQSPACKTFGLDAPSQTTNTGYLCWWCNKLHSMVSPWGCDVTSQQEVQFLLDKSFPPATPPEGARPKSDAPATAAPANPTPAQSSAAPATAAPASQPEVRSGPAPAVKQSPPPAGGIQSPAGTRDTR